MVRSTRKTARKAAWLRSPLLSSSSLSAAALVLGVLAASLAPAGAAKAYTVYSLGGSKANDLNDAGQVVGSSGSSPVYWASYSSSPTTLPALPGGTGDGEAASISQVPVGGTVGHIAGWSKAPRIPKAQITTGCVWDTPSSTPTALPWAYYSSSSIYNARGVNSSLTAVGDGIGSSTTNAEIWTYSASPTPSFTGFAVSSSTNTTNANAVNEAGIAVGSYWNNSPFTNTAPVIYTLSGSTVTQTSIPMGSFQIGTAFDISNGTNYYVVGELEYNPIPPSGPFGKAFIYDSSTGTTTPLDPLSGDVYACALGVNDAGDAVGYSQDSSGNNTAVIWVGMGSPAALPTGSVATAINNNGDIVGYNGSGSGAFYLKY